MQHEVSPIGVVRGEGAPGHGHSRRILSDNPGSGPNLELIVRREGFFFLKKKKKKKKKKTNVGPQP